MFRVIGAAAIGACGAFLLLNADAASAQATGGAAPGIETEAKPLFNEAAEDVQIPPEVAAAFKTVSSDPTTAAARLVELRPMEEIVGVLQAAIVDKDGAAVPFLLDPDTLVYLAAEAFEPAGEDGFDWFATLRDGGGKPLVGSAVISGKADRLFGTVFLDGRQFEFHSVDGGFAILREINASAFPAEHPPAFLRNRRVGIGHGKDAAVAGAGQTLQAAANYTITVLVPYTRAAETRIKASGYANVADFVRASIANANRIYMNSAVNVRLASAKVYRLNNYTETGNWSTDRNRFFTHAGARQERADSDADVAILLFHNPTFCGEVQDIDARYHTAFAVLHWSCSIGNMSFAHEIAHLEGADHNFGDASSPPAYAYGHGYVRASAWRTVLSYPTACGGCPRLPYFSSPAIQHPTDLVPMGTNATHNNARVLRETAARISSFE